MEYLALCQNSEILVSTQAEELMARSEAIQRLSAEEATRKRDDAGRMEQQVAELHREYSTFEHTTLEKLKLISDERDSKVALASAAEARTALLEKANAASADLEAACEAKMAFALGEAVAPAGCCCCGSCCCACCCCCCCCCCCAG